MARKAGGIEVVFSKYHVNVKVLDPDSKPVDNRQIQYYKEMLCGSKNGQYESILESTSCRALVRMLELASRGYDIKCGNYKDSRMFMRRGTTLEQLSIEMELQEAF